MNRPRKKKELSLMEELKELDLLGEGELVEVPDLENDDLIEENSMSVIVRCLNPTVHKVGGLVKALPPIWGMEDRVRGRGVGEDRVQFIFESEGDLYHVLYRGPWFVNGWIVTLDQWKPNPGPDFLKRILFWIRLKGIPIHLLKKQAVESIIEPYGKVDAVELHAKNSPSLEYVRARTWINADEPLQFLKTARFKTGEVAKIELVYEKLLKVCFLCKRLTHDKLVCPYQVQEQQQRRTTNPDSSKEGLKGKGKGKEKEHKDFQAQSSPVYQQKRNATHLSDHSKRPKSIKERLQWNGQRGGSKGSQSNHQEWRPTGRLIENLSEEAGNKSPEGTIISQSKRRRSSSSGERLSKKARLSSGDDHNQSPSVFERLGSSSESLKKQDRRGSGEKITQSSSVFERLGSQASSSSPHISEKSAQSDHSAHVAAQFSNQSASSVAANRSHSSGERPGSEDKNLKEGLMINSNPSNPL